MTGRGSSRATRLVAGIYSRSAGPLYERVVLRTGLPLLARGLNEEAFRHGRRAVEAAGGRPILDMPVGTGHFTRAIAGAHDGLVIGCDIAWGMVETARRSAEQQGLSNLSVVQADAHDLPFDDGTFPVVVSTNGLQVIPETALAVRELVRVTAAGGRIFVAAVAAGASRALPAGARSRMPGFLRDPREIVALFEEAGASMGALTRRRFGYSVEGTKVSRRR